MQHVRIQTRASAMKHKFSDDATMDEIMHRSPAAIRVVLQNGMLCVGCPIASFHTVSDAAREHDLNEEQLSCDLQAAIESSDPD
jgi:hybrid cluster-associated redox disulfide protein